MPKTISEAQRETMRRMRSNGDSFAAIAAAVRCNRKTVSDYLHRTGAAGDRTRKYRYSEKTCDEIVRLYKERVGPTEIAQRLDLHDHTYVYAVLKRYGVQAHTTCGGRSPDGSVTTLDSGYVIEKVPATWPFLGKMAAYGAGGRWIAQHRKVMAEHLGRALLSAEEVHHIDGDRSNNQISNLELRFGPHGRGIRLECASCGSQDITATPLS